MESQVVSGVERYQRPVFDSKALFARGIGDFRGDSHFKGRAIAKQIEVILQHGQSSYYVGVDEAWKLVRQNNAKWLNAKQVKRVDDDREKVTWAPRQSGEAGPLVMQVVG